MGSDELGVTLRRDRDMGVEISSIGGYRIVRHYGNRALKKFIRIAGPRFMGTITHVDTPDLVAALTFDDGP